MPDSNLTTVFAGSPVFAADILRALSNSPFAPVAVYTQPDRAKGRGRKVQPNAVKQLANELGISVLQPQSLRNGEAVAELAGLHPDVLIVAAYGLILPPEILKIPTYGCLNVHASLLPRWRGAAPIERAMMAGDEETGVCIMQMEEGLDTGPIYVSTHIPIGPDTTGEELEKQIAEQGAQDLLEVLEQFSSAQQGSGPRPQPTPQNDNLATYANKLSPLDRTIDWDAPASLLARQINALGQRMPVRVELNNCAVQLLKAVCIEQSPVDNEHSGPGTIVDATKSGIIVQCATDLLQITSLKVERGKGRVLEPAAAINGFKDLFCVGARMV